MTTIILSLAMLLTVLVSTVLADIYRYVNDEGTVCYTDAPQHRKAILIYRAPRKPERTDHGARIPRLLSTVRIGEQLSARRGATTSLRAGSGFLPVSGRVTSLTGVRLDPIDGVLRQHNGVDIAIPKGTPVKPVAPGMVLFSGRRSGYGAMVVVDHGGAYTVYAHHDRNTVSEGEPVTEQTIIAYSGSTGRSTGPHLHFEAWEDGVNVTERFTGTAGAQMAIAHASFTHPAPFRRVVQPDGSLLFTNLPLQHP